MIIKDCWRETRISSNLSFDDRRRTALERLACRYRWFATMALLLCLYCPLTVARYINDPTLRLTTMIVFTVYLLTCSAMDWYLYSCIRAINVASMSVSDVLMRAMQCRKRHLQFVAILVPCACVILGLLFYGFDPNPYMLWGMITGAVVGLAIGTVQLRRFLRDYKSLE